MPVSPNKYTVSTNLLPLISDEGIISVSELSRRIKVKFQQDKNMQDIWVRGEISNLTNHRSGHSYFTLKDKKSQIQCVMFKWYAKRLKFKPETGMKVLVFGNVDTYEARSQYQLQVAALRPDGIGELYKAFEQLKIKLASEGLFDEGHKKPIPRYPTMIGVATSPTGAVIHDIINVTRRRYPVHLLLSPTQVQGVDATHSIIHSLRNLNETGADVIILARGGGSLEDLWPFNEETVARAIYESRVPVVSAVGHETDYTIADFVSDLRAPTPSAAAELTVPDLKEIQQQLTHHNTTLNYTIKSKISELARRIARCESTLTTTRLYELVGTKKEHVKDLNKHLNQLMQHKLEILDARFISCVGHLNAVSPLNTLERGFSITLKEKNIVSSIQHVETGNRIEVVLKDGTLDASVTGIKKGRPWDL